MKHNVLKRSTHSLVYRSSDHLKSEDQVTRNASRVGTKCYGLAERWVTFNTSLTMQITGNLTLIAKHLDKMQPIRKQNNREEFPHETHPNHSNP